MQSEHSDNSKHSELKDTGIPLNSFSNIQENEVSANGLLPILKILICSINVATACMIDVVP